MLHDADISNTIHPKDLKNFMEHNAHIHNLTRALRQ